MNSMRPKKVVHENNFTNTHIMSLVLGILSQKECSRAVLKNLHALNVRRKKNQPSTDSNKISVPGTFFWVFNG